MTDMDKMMIEKLRPKMIDWLNAFKADPFSTGADKVDRLFEVLSENAAISAYNPDDRLREALDYEEIAILHGKRVTVKFKQSADAFNLFNELRDRDAAALSPLPQATK